MKKIKKNQSVHTEIIITIMIRRPLSTLVLLLHFYTNNNNNVIMCIFIYRTYHLSSHGGLQFLLKGNQINIIQITNLQLSFNFT